MSYRETATKLRADGQNCCQAVLGACCEQFGLTQEQAYRLGAFMGSGARTGELCGAMNGALMALGLAYGDENCRQNQSSKKMLAAFRERFGALRCEELKGEHHVSCPELIEWCCDYLEGEFQ